MAIIVGGVIEKDGKYLLVQEAKEKCYGKWNLPAGHLDPNETMLEAAVREVKEETGCDVNLLNVVQIGNKQLENDIFVSIIFSTELISENIKFDKNEILDVKYFDYEEILNMHSELRNYQFITSAIMNHHNGINAPLDIVTIFK